MKKRVMSGLLTIVMLLGMLPVVTQPAAAAVNAETVTISTDRNYSNGLILEAGKVYVVSGSARMATVTNTDGKGGPALKIQGTSDNPTVLYIPSGKILYAQGGPTYPGIELKNGNTLIVTGGGHLMAIGGDASNGTNGEAGEDGRSGHHGYGGAGGNGGTGAGAGIGLQGQPGGRGGSRTGTDGGDGEDGNSGKSAAYTQTPMGELIILGGTIVQAEGGKAGHGARSYTYSETSGIGGKGANVSGRDQSGGGGGGGGGGGSAGYGIGGGGIGGGGGGSGGSGKAGAKGDGGAGARGQDGWSFGSGSEYGAGGVGGRGGGQDNDYTGDGRLAGSGGNGVQKSGYSAGSATAGYKNAANNFNVTEISTTEEYADLISVEPKSAQKDYIYGNSNLVSRRKNSELAATGPGAVKFAITLNANGGNVKNGTHSFSSGKVDVWLGHTTIPNAYDADTWKLTRAGYTLKGFFDKATGGTKYYGADGRAVAVTDAWDTNMRYSKAGSLTLYAQWEPLTAEVTFDPNGGVGNTFKQTWTYDTVIGALSADNIPTNTGYHFSGYFDAQTGGNQIFNASGSMAYNNGKSNYTGAKTLYARWTPITYRIQFYGADGSLLGTMNGVSYEDLTLPGADGMAGGTRVFDGDLRKEGCNFLGWSTVAGQSAAMYRPNVRYTVGLADTQNATVHLFPVWAPMDSYTVTYDANGGQNAPAAGAVREDNTGYRLSDEKPARENYTFLGWADSSTADAAQYQPGGTLGRVASDQVLYAVWKHNPRVVYDANGGYFTVSLPVDYPAPGSDYTLTTIKPVQAGHKFLGWSINDADVEESGVYHVGDGDFSDLIFRAKWRAANYRLTLDTAVGVTLTFEMPNTVTSGNNYPYQTRFAFTAAGNGTVRVYLNGVLLSPQDDGKYHFTLTEASTLKTTLTPVEPTYIVSYSPNGGHDAPFDRASYRAGGVVTIASGDGMTRTGYLFAGWNTQSDGSGNSYQAGDSLTMGGADTVLYAQWRPITYTVAYDANGGEGTMSGTNLTYDVGGTIAENTFTRTGYAFKGWARSSGGLAAYLGGETVRNLTDQDDNTITLYAVWAPKEVIVKLDAKGGQSDSYVKATYDAALPAITAPVRMGYTFGGFYLNAEEYYGADGSAVRAAWNRDVNTTLTAKWTANRYEIAFDGNGSSSGSMAALSVVYDLLCALPQNAFVRDGYMFRGWSRTANGAAEFSDEASVKNLSAVDGATVTLYAVWEPVPTYTVTYDANGGTGGPAQSDPVQTGGTCTVSTETPLRPGFDFLGWSSHKNAANADPAFAPGTVLTLTGNLTLYAVWRAVPTYLVTYDGNGGGDTVENVPNAGTKTQGVDYVISSLVPTRAGYDFTGWSDGTVTYRPGGIYSADAPVTLLAQWTRRAFTLTLDDGGAGTIAVTRGGEALSSGSRIFHGDTLTITARPLDGYTTASFLCYLNSAPLTGGADAVSATMTVTGDVTVQLVDLRSGGEVRYTVKYDANGGNGTINDQPQISTAPVPLSDGTGFQKEHAQLLGWATAPNGGVVYALSETPAAPLAGNGGTVTLYAVWQPDAAYTVTYDANGGIGGPTDSTSYYENDPVTLLFSPAPVREGWVFLGWSRGRGAAAPDYTEHGLSTLTLGAADLTLYAVWQRDAYAVTVENNGVADVTITTQTDAQGKFPGDTTVEFTVAAAGGSVLGALSASVNGIFLQLSADPANPDQLRGVFLITRDSVLSIHAGASYYTVTYDANGGDTPAAAETVRCITGQTVVLHGGSGYARNGYHLTGWNTAANGSGTTYTLGALVAGFNDDTTLYAVWEQDADPRGYHYTIVYDANNGSGHSVSQDMYQNRLDTQLYGVSQTGFSKDHATLSGWATAPNGSVSYALDSRLPAPIGAAGQTVTLYAVWQADKTYTVTYDADGGVGGPTDSGVYYENDTVNVQFTSVPTRVGYTFLGWSKDRNAAAAAFTGSGTTTFKMGSANVTLYAVWQQNAATYTVRYDANGGSGIPVDGNAYSTGANVIVLFTPQPSKAGWTFLGWARSSTAATPDYTTQNASFRMGSSNVTLYAVWKQIRSYTVIYNANAGGDLVIGLPGNGTKAEGVAYVISQTIPARDGYTFLKWNTAADGSGADFHIGQSYTEDRDLTLYAVWQRDAYGITVADNGVANVTVTTRADAAGGKFSGGTTVEFTISAIAPNVLNSLMVAVNGAVLQMTEDNANSCLTGSFVIDRDSTISVHSGAQTYRVTYDANGGEPAQSEAVTYVTGQPLTLHSGKSYTRSGYHLADWNTAADGSGTTYALGAVLTSNLQTYTLYAMWEQDDPRGYRYTIEYDANGGSGVSVTQTMYQNELDTKLYGVSQTRFVKDGSTLIGWATAPNGSVSYALDSRLPAPLGAAGQTVTLYAVWQLNEITVTLSDPQNVNTVPSITVRVGSMYGVLPILTKDGYLFNGWYNDRGRKIESTTLVTNGAPHTLYARWSPVGGGSGGGAVVPQEPETVNGYSVSYKDCPRDKTCPAYHFKDLNLKLWYHDGIHFCVENGLMQGIPEGLFAPNGTTTRAQIVTILWRVEGMPFVERASFPDVTDDSWYAGSVNWAAANGIVLGYDDGRFGPDDSITREQFAAILYRYARYKGYDVSVGEDTNILSYEDALKVSDWAVGAMQWACGSGVINGTSESMLSPQDTATRAQAAAMIMRFVTLA